ncbi:MAG: hypothetical protein JHD15_13200 [Phenylobacterium sp.]|uniref:hypothetical protein n=1 Tax=unclassified Phenylobacterium TaxID=2640670 RepID=UPI001A1BF81F|nr:MULTISPECIES: hypothetical protein [unclassified Phenylobacterium]MBJ7411306.1 hypothetical protein [Phenylobacterium sp.]
MPSDVSVELVSRVSEVQPARRLPVGMGLAIGAGASLALWTCIGLGLRALLA